MRFNLNTSFKKHIGDVFALGNITYVQKFLSNLFWGMTKNTKVEKKVEYKQE